MLVQLRRLRRWPNIDPTMWLIHTVWFQLVRCMAAYFISFGDKWCRSWFSLVWCAPQSVSIIAGPLSNVVLILVQRRRRWANIKGTLVQRLGFPRVTLCLCLYVIIYASSQQRLVSQAESKMLRYSPDLG